MKLTKSSTTVLRLAIMLQGTEPQYNGFIHLEAKATKFVTGYSDNVDGTASREGYDFRLELAQYVRSQALPVDKLGHQPRLYALTRLVGEGMSYDDDVVYAAAWLHDLGVFVGHRPEDPEKLSGWDNVTYAMQQSPPLLHQFGFPATKVAQVVEAIRTHQPHLKPTALEGTILRDADILEQLGSIGILRVVAKIGRDTRYPTFTSAAATLRKSLADLPGKLHLETAKILARPRITLLQAFLAELENEAHDALC
jgi:uncharacterized protein